MEKLFFYFAFLFSVVVAVSPAMALDLNEAKSKGLVGEQSSGYIASVSPAPDAEVTALVHRINGLRKKEYEKIARKNGTPLAVVETIGGKKAIKRTPSGQFVKIDGRPWKRK